MPAATLTVCVIGRNVAQNLPQLVASLSALAGRGIAFDTIYVDSASEDGSAEVASSHFGQVLRLPAGDSLCASLGRYWGTLRAQSEWVLYLDGDMTLEAGFAPVISAWLGQPPGPDCAGLYGQCLDVHPEEAEAGRPATERIRVKRVTQFGGAVLLRRAAVIAAGNWDPALFAWEELDLFVRLRGRGWRIEHRPQVMVRHHTRRIPRLRMLIGNAWPRGSVLGAKFAGFGQVLHAAARRGGVRELLRFHPWPFAWWIAVIAGGMTWAIGSRTIAVIVFATGFAWVAIGKGPKFAVLYTLLPIQAVWGWPRYRTAKPPEPVEVGGRIAPAVDAG